MSSRYRKPRDPNRPHIAEFAREISDDVSASPLAALTFIMAALYAVHGVYVVLLATDGDPVQAAFAAGFLEVLSLTFAHKARRSFVNAGNRFSPLVWTWGLCAFLPAAVSAYVAYSFGQLVHGEGIAGLMRIAAPLVAATAAHLLFLGSVEEVREMAKARMSEASDAAVIRLMKAAKTVGLAAGDDRRAAVLAMNDVIDSVHSTIDPGKPGQAVVSQWQDRERFITGVVRQVSNEAATWLDDGEPADLSGPQLDAADRATRAGGVDLERLWSSPSVDTPAYGGPEVSAASADDAPTFQGIATGEEPVTGQTKPVVMGGQRLALDPGTRARILACKSDVAAGVVTQKHVAEMYDVSPATVSRIFNG